ncbi:WD40 repeat domain-containing serine/threonine protein kinase [Nocardiopsis sp. MG754419]|uniref:WD40 repeat domain-containing serine/threonine protein kinase n=1 Tax=Nocardiopsis sp. MG754419 TaxID=2259865 RepID=UPI001BADFF6A|nr:serine/threonine-protein kinase [Nocardiopsis sp. MG754419]MBR8744346.1 hypothetical protein [Nocardiopsis sp. MG754419]
MRPLSPDDPFEVGGHRLLRRVGAGGMGIVYLARPPGGGEPCALKVVRHEYADDPEFRARFAREVRTARRVQGRFTARVLGSDVDGSRAWLATEYVAGPSLEGAVRHHGPFPEDTLGTLGSGLAEALTAIHGVGLVHRDLKPSNVLLGEDGPKVIDFGVARAVEGTVLTVAGRSLGSPGYMSPEQVRGDDVGPASDVFSLGCVLAYAGTGRPPFGSGPVSALLFRLVAEEPDLDGIPGSLLDVVRACLSKDPGDRPTAADLVSRWGGTGVTEILPLPDTVATEVHRARTALLQVSEDSAEDSPVPATRVEEDESPQDAPPGGRETPSPGNAAPRTASGPALGSSRHLPPPFPEHDRTKTPLIVAITVVGLVALVAGLLTREGDGQDEEPPGPSAEGRVAEEGAPGATPVSQGFADHMCMRAWGPSDVGGVWWAGSDHLLALTGIGLSLIDVAERVEVERLYESRWCVVQDYERRTVDVSDDGAVAVLHSEEDRAVLRWDLASGEALPPIEHGDVRAEVDLSADGSRLTMDGGELTVHDFRSGEEVHRGEDRGRISHSLSADGSTLAELRDTDRHITLVDLDSGEDGATLDLPPETELRQSDLLTHGPGNLLAYGGVSHVLVWDTATTELIAEFTPDLALRSPRGRMPEAMEDLRFADATTLSAAYGAHGMHRATVMRWDLDGPRELEPITEHAGLYAAYDPLDPDRMATLAAPGENGGGYQVALIELGGSDRLPEEPVTWMAWDSDATAPTD